MAHGGNIYQFAEKLNCLSDQIVDFSANINPRQAVDLNCLQKVQLDCYAEPYYQELKQALQQRYSYPSNVDIEVFNGASSAIFSLLRWLQPKKLVLYAPLYGEYAQIANELSCTIYNINRLDKLMTDIPRGSTVIFVNPSTPDGKLYDLQALFAQWKNQQCTVIIDESFLDFCDADSTTKYIAEYDKLFVIKSLSKFYGCAGIRIGFIMAETHTIKALKRLEPAWKLSSLDMTYMQHALKNTVFIEQTKIQTNTLRNLLHSALENSDLFEAIYPGQANFLLAKLVKGDGHQLQTQLEPARILIRVCDNFEGLDKTYVRFAVKDEQSIVFLGQQLSKVNLAYHLQPDSK